MVRPAVKRLTKDVGRGEDDGGRLFGSLGSNLDISDVSFQETVEVMFSRVAMFTNCKYPCQVCPSSVRINIWFGNDDDDGGGAPFAARLSWAEQQLETLAVVGLPKRTSMAFFLSVHMMKLCTVTCTVSFVNCFLRVPLACLAAGQKAAW